MLVGTNGQCVVSVLYWYCYNCVIDTEVCKWIGFPLKLSIQCIKLSNDFIPMINIYKDFETFSLHFSFHQQLWCDQGHNWNQCIKEIKVRDWSRVDFLQLRVCRRSGILYTLHIIGMDLHQSKQLCIDNKAANFTKFSQIDCEVLW